MFNSGDSAKQKTKGCSPLASVLLTTDINACNSFSRLHGITAFSSQYVTGIPHFVSSACSEISVVRLMGRRGRVLRCGDR